MTWPPVVAVDEAWERTVDYCEQCGDLYDDHGKYRTCYRCYLERVEDLELCWLCERRRHSGRFDTCYQCRPVYDRDPGLRIIRDEVMHRDGHQCSRCGSRHRLEIDHIEPVASGGTADPWNLQVLCHDCNQAKGRTWYVGGEWWKRQRTLVRCYYAAGWRSMPADQRRRLAVAMRGGGES